MNKSYNLEIQLLTIVFFITFVSCKQEENPLIEPLILDIPIIEIPDKARTINVGDIIHDFDIDFDLQFQCESMTEVPERIKTFLIAGQSNAGNLGYTQEIPEGYLDGICAWHYFRPELGFIELQQGNNEDHRGGVEMAIGRELSLKYNEPILIYKYSKGDTPLVQNDNLQDWSVHSNELFEKFILNYSSMINDCNHCETDIIGMAWIQGEKDAALFAEEDDYLNELTDLMGSVRNTFGMQLPVSIVQLNISHPSSKYNKTKIRNAQNNFVDNDGNAFLIDIDDIDYDPDNIPHYGMAGYLEIGRRIAENY